MCYLHIRAYYQYYPESFSNIYEKERKDSRIHLYESRSVTISTQAGNVKPTDYITCLVEQHLGVIIKAN